MKTNSKRKVFGDAVDLLMGDMEEVTMPRGVQMVPVKSIHPFHDHPFHLYEGERLEDMIASVKEHGVLNPVIVQKLDTGYEMLSGHNRWNAAKLAGIKEIPAIVKTDLSEEEAYVYVIETQVICLGLSFGDVDVPYLDRIEYEVRPETKWLVYYHSDEDLKRLKSVFGITGISRKFEVYFRKSDNFWDR